jgi:hypothetical protein
MVIVFAAILLSRPAYSAGAGKDKKLAFLDYTLPASFSDCCTSLPPMKRSFMPREPKK